MMKKFTILMMWLMGSGAILAQDYHFSQFYMSPLTLNPAMTGVIGCDMRFAINYRNQWASVLGSNAFKTYSASFDARRPVGRYDYFGIGGGLMADRAGSGSLSTINAFGSASYLKRLGGYRSKESYLVAGAYLGVTQRDIDLSKLMYGNQYDGEAGADPTITDPLTSTLDPNFFFADMGAGVLYFASLNKQNTSNFYAGLAFSHLNRANMSFTRRNFEGLYTKVTFHAGGEFSVSDKLGITPNIMYLKQGPSFEFNGGTALKFKFTKNRQSRQSFSLGGLVRIAGNYESSFISDAAIITARFDMNNFALGLSYDFNISSLKPATSGNGSFEIAMMYRICKDRRRKLSCPDF